MNREGTIYTVVFVFIVSFLFVLLLSLANQATIQQVQLNAELVRQRAVLSAFGIAATTDQEVEAKYAQVQYSTDTQSYSAVVGGQPALAVEFAGPGLWGTITGVLAVTASVDEILGLEIMSDNETPGLGARINEAWFKDQFRGESVAGQPIRVVAMPGDGDPSKSDNAVDAITGATRTSEAIQAIVNTTLDRLRSIASGNGTGGNT